MDMLEILAARIEASEHLLRKHEVMKWAEQDLQEALAMVLEEPDMPAGLQAHAQVSFGALFRYGPLYHEIKHIRPDFVITDSGRFPIAFIDYLGAGHDPAFDGVKRAVAKKGQMIFLQVPERWAMCDLREMMVGAFGALRQAKAA